MKLTNSHWLAMGLMCQEDLPMVYYFQLSRVGFWGIFCRCVRSLPGVASILTYSYIGWTRAWVTDIITFDDLRPTVIETLIFWLASSLGTPGGFTIPEVCNEPVYRTKAYPCTANDVVWEHRQKAAALALTQIS